MQRVRKRLKGRLGGYTWQHRLQLRVQWDYFDEAFGNPPESLPAMRDAWEEIGDSVLEEHVRERPLSRPWAWWQWSAPEPRDPTAPESEQLFRLGVLRPEELSLLERLQQDDLSPKKRK